MTKASFLLFSAMAWLIPVHSQEVTRRANINGNAVDGKCTIEVDVDGAAEVEVRGDQGRMRTLSGQRAVWRRFECNGRMPANPHDFRFRGIDGRGDVQLVQDPRQGGGRIVFRIEDRQGGREGYTVDLEWRGSNNGQWNSQDNRGWRGPDYRDSGDIWDQRDGRNRNSPGYQDQRFGQDRYRPGYSDRERRYYYDDRGRWNAAGTARAVSICQSAAAQRLQQDGFRNVTFHNIIPDNNPGRNDWVIGRASARVGFMRNAVFDISCSVNLANGNVRTVEVVRR